MIRKNFYMILLTGKDLFTYIICMSTKKIIIPIPSYGFDPTEVAITWKLLSQENFKIVFITPQGNKAAADDLMLKGRNLGIWKPILKTRQDAIDAYNEMVKNEDFCNPMKYIDVREKDFDAIFLPGGHEKSIKEYLESKILQTLIVDFFKVNKPIGAICHGVVLVARSINPDTKKSVIHNYNTTALLKSQELLAYNLTRLWLKDYYLTYPEIMVEDEVTSVLADSKQFLKGSFPVFKDHHKNLKRGFTVKDRNYLSARWPGDVYSFALEFIKMLKE